MTIAQVNDFDKYCPQCEADLMKHSSLSENSWHEDVENFPTYTIERWVYRCGAVSQTISGEMHEDGAKHTFESCEDAYEDYTMAKLRLVYGDEVVDDLMDGIIDYEAMRKNSEHRR